MDDNITKKGLKIQQEYSEAVDRRQTDNIMAKRKWTKIHTVISKTKFWAR
jgi:hypothetical protein